MSTTSRQLHGLRVGKQVGAETTHTLYNEARQRIADLDAYSQPTRITERGFSPLDEQGQAKPTPISRTTTYAYRTINHRSVLVAIDGPLPNGPRNDPSGARVRPEEQGSGLYFIPVFASARVR
ncbi:hypothetical protein [Thiobacter aerophilum]|uniref:Uncharacterized protein n=1 Tax=Thiobacter aerophilum TaxID=3121275 RepID=A0ABV0ECD7_9BURK